MSITSNQIEAFAKTLVQQGIIDKSDVELKRDRIEEAIRISQGSGLLAPVMSNTQDGKLYYDTPRPLVNQSTGRAVTRPVTDQVEIYQILELSEQNARFAKQREDAILTEQSDREFYDFDRTMPYGDMRFDVYTQRQKTKEWFREFPFKCPMSGSCTRRFKSQREALNHRMQHAMR
jgi:hypothetical protein